MRPESGMTAMPISGQTHGDPGGGEPSSTHNELLDMERFVATPLSRDPFDYVIVPGFIRAEAVGAVSDAFPIIDRGGSYPPRAFKIEPVLTQLLNELQGPDLTRVFADKFAIDLTGRPTLVTLRGQSRSKDGRIHRDSKSKLLTALIYMNFGWEQGGGRLRLLRGRDDIEDYAAEVTPDPGTLVVFRCARNAYHGHKPYEGVRRSIQLNWMNNAAVARSEGRRHLLSAVAKRLGF